MPAAGTHSNHSLARYNALKPEPAIYLMEINGSVVKVGRSDNVRSRLRELHMEVQGRGDTPGHFTVFRVSNTNAVENLCVSLLSLVAHAEPNRREYFTGITFAQAVRVVSRTITALATTKAAA